MSPDDVAARETLAAAHRIAVHDGLTEGTWNHFSYMLDERRMLITPADRHWSLITADSLAVVGEDEDPRARGLQFYIGYRIHLPVHQLRPDARCVMHLHSPYATALSVLDGEGLITMSQSSVEFHGRVAYNDEFDLLVGPERQGTAIAEAMGDKDVLFLRGHGVVVAAATIERAYLDAYLLELACRTQVLAMSTGRPLRTFTEEQALRLVPQSPDFEEAERHFAAMRDLVGVAPGPALAASPVVA
jgi:ribulose-5-phosphate 4-epimerase/fuculose-1-phosphate aldolase